MDTCVQCGQQDLDTIDGVCLGCDIDNGLLDEPKGGAVSGFSISKGEDGRPEAKFLDADGDQCSIRIDIDGALLLVAAKPPCVGLNRQSAAFVRDILDQYIATGRIPQVVTLRPPPAEATLDQFRDLYRLVDEVDSSHRLSCGTIVDLKRRLAYSEDLIKILESDVSDLRALSGSDSEQQTSANRRLAAVESAVRSLKASLPHSVLTSAIPSDYNPFGFHNGNLYLKPDPGDCFPGSNGPSKLGQ